MQNNKSIFDFYQSSGVYDRVILNKKFINNTPTLQDLRDKILNLKEFYKKNEDEMVFADGNPNSKIMIIGDAPGVSDETTGKPFSGETGNLLDKMLSAINLDRNKVYLTNIINFRLADNKRLSQLEIHNYKSLIFNHIKIINPKIIFLLGSVAYEFFCEKKESTAKSRGHWTKLNINNHEFDCLTSYHPAFLLRQPDQKKASWEDLKKLKQRIVDENLC